MVGTIEPRKGYDYLFGYLERFADIRVVIVGRQGWASSNLVAKLRSMSRRGRVMWLPNTSDAQLEQLYQSCSLGLCLSRDEGFGLPLIEMLVRGIPVVANDIAVFREVGGTAPIFVQAREPESVRAGILQAMKGHDAGSLRIPLRTWKDATVGWLPLLSSATHSECGDLG
jgi:glycosyltransferase involved in cell wall biosynthesis